MNHLKNLDFWCFQVNSGMYFQLFREGNNRQMNNSAESIMDLNLQELQEWLVRQGEPPYRAKQITRWLYIEHVSDIEEMTNLSKSLRKKLAREFAVLNGRIIEHREHTDGTVKFGIALADNQPVETVYLPRAKRKTLCISSQAGCALGCKFCATGMLGIIRNLTCGEILSQIIHARRHVEFKEHGNIVFMGMGEPLMNTLNVIQSIKVLTSDWGFGWSPRRITVSTAGIVPEIRRMGQAKLGVNLAISLNAPDDRIRSRLMPINRKYPLKMLMQAIKDYPLSSGQQKITFEYIMLRGINDSPEHAVKLIKLLPKNRSKLNLIPFNPIEGSRYHPTDGEQIVAFQDILTDAGFLVRIRKSQGRAIQAACGQLAGNIVIPPEPA